MRTQKKSFIVIYQQSKKLAVDTKDFSVHFPCNRGIMSTVNKAVRGILYIMEASDGGKAGEPIKYKYEKSIKFEGTSIRILGHQSK
jgi:hypothetical protein